MAVKIQESPYKVSRKVGVQDPAPEGVLKNEALVPPLKLWCDANPTYATAASETQVRSHFTGPVLPKRSEPRN